MLKRGLESRKSHQTGSWIGFSPRLRVPFIIFVVNWCFYEMICAFFFLKRNVSMMGGVDECLVINKTLSFLLILFLNRPMNAI